MALTEDSILDIQVKWLDPVAATEDQPAMPGRYVLEVRRADRILRDGTVVSKQYHRHVAEVDGDLTGEVKLVRDVAAAVRGR